MRPRAPLDLIGAEAWTLVDATGDAQGWRVRRTAAATTIVRDDEPVALVLDAAAAAALATVGVDLRSRQPLRLDPTRVAAIGADGVTITRGAVLGEWTASTGTVTAAAAALPALLAALQVDRHAAVATLGRVRRTLTVTIDAEPPVTVAVGAADRTGCWISLDPAAAAHVPAATCAALLAPLTAR
ncbi:MAG: hypothetical protein IPL61_16755 [Myxococcales bacterium]|nr:hypothetical protein [Myxococcales bacterium]